MRRTLLTVVGGLGVALLLVACGGDGDDGEQQTPTAAASPAVTATAPPPPETTPAPTPVVEDGEFEFPEHSYAAAVPEGWIPRFSLFLSPAMTTDAFFGEEEDGVQPNISVTCETPPQPVTLDEFVEQRMIPIRALSSAEPAASDITVGDSAGRRMDYSRPGRENLPSIDKTDIFFLADPCAWTISLVAPAGAAGRYAPVLEEFLASFRVLPAP